MTQLHTDNFQHKRFQQKIVAWHHQHGRKLPWRESRDPYTVWISEIMLQQTTVMAVKPYYDRFLQHFPTVQALAAASEAQVLKQWEGLGYYRRARNLHRAAQVIVHELAGQFPATVIELQKLAGIGRYTAGAIASFAYDLSAPILEANTQRLYARLLNLAQAYSSKGQRQLWDFAESIIPKKNCGEFNQALMDLGSLICTPVNPDCENCPVKAFCAAFQQGNQLHVPQKPAKPEITPLTEIALVIQHQGKFALKQCGPDERWAGLWDFPRLSISSQSNKANTTSPDVFNSQTNTLHQLPLSLIAEAHAKTGLHLQFETKLATWKHSVTRYRITLHCVQMLRLSGKLQSPFHWIPHQELHALPLSVTGRKLAEML